MIENILYRGKNQVIGFFVVCLCFFPFIVSAQEAAATSCYSHISYIKPESNKANRVLYVLIDQTTPLSKAMRQKVTALVTSWGQSGDQVKIASFSANMKDRHLKLVYDKRRDVAPSQNFLYQLRQKDKQKLLECFESYKGSFNQSLTEAMEEVMRSIDIKIPKTEILFSLKELSRSMIAKSDAEHKVVLIVSNGMEHNPNLSFYSKGTIKMLETRKIISKVRRLGLIGHWQGANIYMYGLGLLESDKKYVQSSRLKQLREFWENYFVEGGGNVAALGMPELLVSTLE